MISSLRLPLGEDWLPSSFLSGFSEKLSDNKGHEIPGGGRTGIIHAVHLGNLLCEKEIRLPVYLAHLSIRQNEAILNQSIEMVVPLDPWGLTEVEDFCRKIHLLGLGVIPLPVAPVHDSFDNKGLLCKRSWAFPDWATLEERARRLLIYQIEGLACWGKTDEAGLERIEWKTPEDSFSLLRQTIARLMNLLE